MKDYLWEVVKNTGMFIAGVFIIALYGVGLVSLYFIITNVCSYLFARLYGI